MQKNSPPFPPPLDLKRVALIQPYQGLLDLQANRKTADKIDNAN
jgi:hypothetical protein